MTKTSVMLWKWSAVKLKLTVRQRSPTLHPWQKPWTLARRSIETKFQRGLFDKKSTKEKLDQQSNKRPPINPKTPLTTYYLVTVILVMYMYYNIKKNNLCKDKDMIFMNIRKNIYSRWYSLLFFSIRSIRPALQKVTSRNKMTSYVTSHYANGNVSGKYCAVLKTKNYVFITQTIRLPKNFWAQKINNFM